MSHEVLYNLMNVDPSKKQLWFVGATTMEINGDSVDSVEYELAYPETQAAGMQ